MFTIQQIKESDALKKHPLAVKVGTVQQMMLIFHARVQ
jgi:hypothetical protein